MLLHINGKFTMRKLKSPLFRNVSCREADIAVYVVSLLQVQWDTCDQSYHQTYIYLLTEQAEREIKKSG